MKIKISFISTLLILCLFSVGFGKYSLRNSLSGNASLTTAESFKIQLPTIYMPSMKEQSVSMNSPQNISFKEENFKEGYSTDSDYTPYSISSSLLTAVYLFSSICFIFCLKGLSNHETSRRGNMLGCVGIIAAVMATLTQVGYGFRFELFLGISVPAVLLGLYIAKKVDMIQMPQLIALFHSFVGLAALFVGFSKYHSFTFNSTEVHMIHLVELYLGAFVGSITFIGSLVAAGKLSGVLESKSLKLKGKKMINISSLVAIIVLGHQFLTSDYVLTKTVCLYLSLIVDMFLGFHLTASIGGADMPVVISVLNSYSGLATVISGFLLSNSLLIVSGSLIASSGAILSYIMCKGMNRDIMNIVLGGWDDEEEEDFMSLDSNGKEDPLKRKMKQHVSEITHASVADELINAKKVVIVPGYGVAVSKCQRELSEISSILRSRGIEVTFAIHPVAGRMPGHLNVLLAEANIPYQIVKEMSEVNPTISNADVILVVGANDTVNPSSYDKSSKIYGMPVIEVWKGKKVIVMKRSMAVGYSAIQNPLFFFPNTSMVFGDAKFTSNQILTILNDYNTNKRFAVPEIEDLERATSRANADILALSDSSSSGEFNLEQLEKEYPKFRRVIGIVSDNGAKLEESTGCNLTMVPITPKFIPELRKMGFKVLVEDNIGSSISISNEEYVKYGGEIETKENVLKNSNIILKVDPPKRQFIEAIPNNTVCISNVWAGINKEILDDLVKDRKKNNITYIALDQVPRITRAQKLDIRSAMSNLQGYRAVLEAFILLPKFSKSSITAAGKINPSKVFVVGAGVSGLQAIATAKSLGCIVYASDPRESTEEEVKSCGGIFVKVPRTNESDKSGKEREVYAAEMSEDYLRRQRETFAKVIRKCDVVICTASIPGKTAPKLVSTEMIKMMKPGSVAVDLSTEFGDKAENWGGNIECSVSNKNVVVNGVHVLGRDKIERNMPIQASNLYSMNIINLLEEMGGGLQFNVDMNNEIINSMVIVKEGKILYSKDKQLQKENVTESIFLSHKEEVFNVDVADLEKKQEIKSKNMLAYGICKDLFSSDISFIFGLIFIALGLCIVGSYISTTDLHHLFLFILSSIVGYYCVWSVTPSLHTPLMSVTNALSGVIIIGGMLEYGNGINDISTIFSAIATFLAALNLSGGFYVTKKMLAMF